LPNNRTRQTPRKSSTNTRALSTRISKIQKEINPYIHLSGGTAAGTITTAYIDRKTQGEYLMASSVKTVLPSDFRDIIPDGAKILGMKISNVTGRKLQVTVPPDSGLILTGGSTSAQNKGLTRVAYAPLSRFPVVNIQIPDLVASNMDTGSNVGQLLLLTTDGVTDRVVIRLHYKQAI